MLARNVSLQCLDLRFGFGDTTAKQRGKKDRDDGLHNQQLVGTSCRTSTQCGIAPTTKPRHSTAPLGFPGKQITSVLSTTTARLRERMALGVSFKDSKRIASPKPGSSRKAI